VKRPAIAAILTAVPAVASAQAVQVTSTTDVGWHGNNSNADEFDDNYAHGVQRLFATMTSGKWVLGTDFQLSGFAATPTPDGETSALEHRYDNRIVAERAWVGWQGRNAEVIVGDSYVAFGRGLGLTLRKVDDLGVDTALRGAKVVWRQAPVDATLTAGYTNIANLDLASGRRADDPEDLIGGGQVMLRLGRVKLGGHAETIAFRRPLGFVPPDVMPPSFADRWVLAGPVFDAPRLAKSLGVYAEAIMQDRADARGYGAYGAVTYTKGPVNVLVEGKAYGDLAVVQPKFDDTQAEFATVRYTTPPTVERLLQPLEHAQQHIGGGRARVDYRIGTQIQLTGSYGMFRDNVGYLTHVGDEMPPEIRPGTIHDPWGGVAMAWGRGTSRASLSGGMRVVLAEGTNERVRRDRHVEYDITNAIGKAWQVQLHGTHLQRAKVVPPFIDEMHIEGTAQAGAIYRGRVSVGGNLDYTTEQFAPRTLYPSATVGLRSARANVDVMAGRMRGGLKCVSGVCREFPPFDGARMTLTLRY
jgi:hypothetical protein